LAVDRGINGKVHPKQPGQMGVVLRNVAEGLVRDKADRAGCDRQNGMVHRLHQEAVQVDEVAGHMKGRDLALAIAEEVVAPGKALQQKRALGGTISLPEDVLAFAHHS
jgi:hypothetical protein